MFPDKEEQVVEEMMSAREKPMPPATKEDYIIRLLESLVNLQTAAEGRTTQMLPFEGDLAAGAEAKISVDVEHDAWLIWFTPVAGGIIRAWPGGRPGAGIEFRTGNGVRIRSPLPELYLRNMSATVAVHWFATVLSQAEAEFFTVA